MGNGSRLFYYRDQTGQAVGPLPLSEIERFVKAGVLPADVQVREEGRDTWKSIKSSVADDILVDATLVSESPTQRDSTRSTSKTTAEPTLKRRPRKIFGESIGSWMGCAVALIAATVFYMFLLQPFFWLMEWFFDKFIF